MAVRRFPFVILLCAGFACAPSLPLCESGNVCAFTGTEVPECLLSCELDAGCAGGKTCACAKSCVGYKDCTLVCR